MKSILSYLVFIFYFFPLYSNPISIIGKVVDSNTGSPVQFATVFLANTTSGVTTNERGEFTLSFLKEGVSNLVISHVGYETFMIDIAEENDSLNILIKLKPKIFDIQTVNVTASDPNRKYRLKVFSKGLFGESKNANSCKILNPSISIRLLS